MQVVQELKSEPTVQYIRRLESDVRAYRAISQVDKQKEQEVTTALRAAQRRETAEASRVRRAASAPLKRAPYWPSAQMQAGYGVARLFFMSKSGRSA